jgi:hypothetical protein
MPEARNADVQISAETIVSGIPHAIDGGSPMTESSGSKPRLLLIIDGEKDHMVLANAACRRQGATPP